MNTRAHRLYRSEMFLILFLIFFIFQTLWYSEYLKNIACVSVCACVHEPLENFYVHDPITQEETIRVNYIIRSKDSYGFPLGEHNVGDGRGLVWPKTRCNWAHRRITKPSSDKRNIPATLTTLYTELFLKIEMLVDSSKSIPQSMWFVLIFVVYN